MITGKEIKKWSVRKLEREVKKDNEYSKSELTKIKKELKRRKGEGGMIKAVAKGRSSGIVKDETLQSEPAEIISENQEAEDLPHPQGMLGKNFEKLKGKKGKEPAKGVLQQIMDLLPDEPQPSNLGEYGLPPSADSIPKGIPDLDTAITESYQNTQGPISVYMNSQMGADKQAYDFNTNQHPASQDLVHPPPRGYEDMSARELHRFMSYLRAPPAPKPTRKVQRVKQVKLGDRPVRIAIKGSQRMMN